MTNIIFNPPTKTGKPTFTTRVEVMKERRVKEGAQPIVPESFQYERLSVLNLGLLKRTDSRAEELARLVQRLEARVAVLEAA